MKATKPIGIILLLAVLAVLALGTACSSGDGAVGPQGPQGLQGAQGVQGTPGPNMIVAMGMVSSDATLAQAYNVDSVTWDATNSRYLVKLTGITYSHTGYVTVVTAADSNYTATYGADNGNLVVFFRNTSAVKQKAHFSFVVLKAP